MGSEILRAMNGHRLLIATPQQAWRHVRTRHRHQKSEREGLLQDRAAAFWLCAQARQDSGPLTHWALLPPRKGPLPRLHMVPCGGVGMAIERHKTLVQILDFSTPSLCAHGALWIAWPLCPQEVDKAFGAGAWGAFTRAQALEHKSIMDRELGPARRAMAKDRL